MVKSDRIREKILLANADANIDFADLCRLLVNLGFSERIKGSHHIFVRTAVDEIINLQPKGNKAKAYQVKQVRNIILKYKLASLNE
jgi:predicted RNA binding protein YcfA (HicA-like mRNA interferase family)